jgi:hypothetical protein
MSRRSPANETSTLPGIPAPAVYDEPPPNAPVSVEAGSGAPPEHASAPLQTDELTEPTALEGQPTNTQNFDPYRFGATSFPPGLRSELIRTKLPRVDPEQLKDTLPPNAGIEALVTRPAGRSRLVMAGAVAVFVIGGLLGWVALSGGEDGVKVPPERASAPANTAAVASTPALAVAATAPVSKSAAPDPQAAETPREKINAQATNSSPQRPSSAPAPSTRGVRTAPVAERSEALRPAVSVAPSGTASNADLFDLPIGPKPR